MNSRYSFAKRLIAGVALACMTSQTVLAAATDISSTPLSSGTTPVLPNVMFILDDSISMGQEALPDYVEAASLGNPAPGCPHSADGLGFVPAATGTSADCNHGDAAYDAGGARGFNGIYYDPTINYLPAVKADGTTYLPDAGAIPGVYDLSTTALKPDAYLGGTNVNLTSSTFKVDRQYCNANNLCKKNGETAAGALITAPTDNDSRTGGATFTLADGQFPYRAHKSNSSSQIFGLPEVMAGATWTRSGTTVTVTTMEPHGLTTASPDNRIYLISSNGNNSNAAITFVNATTFTYTGVNSGATSGELVYRKHTAGPAVVAVRVASSTTVTVTSAGHGLVANDRISTFNNGTANVNANNVNVIAATANTFTYTSGGNTLVASTTITWVRNGLYNIASNQSNYPIYYTITPVEYCSDAALTTCDISTTLGTPPAGFSFPATTRFCKTFADSIAPGAVSGLTGGTARCRSKFVDGVTTNYQYPRFGLFKRTVVKTTGVGGPASYPKGANRIDCSGATCTYTDEIQNYARWYTYYRTRMQMMKSAAGLAFSPFVSNPSATPPRPNKLRVGFLTINPTGTASPTYGTSSVTAAKYLRIDDFNLTNATAWYTKLYAQAGDVGSTPLREALATAGWIYAGKMNTGLSKGILNADDPVQASCQRNFAILTTDGYWNNDQKGRDLSGNFIGNEDNTDNLIYAPYTNKTVSRDTGTYDGNFNASTAGLGVFGGSSTLADVALYYYRRDLRGGTAGHTGPTNNLGGTGTVDVSANNVSVKAGNKDFVTHQHMVTFTVGIVDGLMRYQSDYETATTGDFADIKNGATGCTFSTTATCNWPAPQAQHASGLDDLWHAAVNSRGTFFSARDPAALTGGLSSALSALNAQVAAAAASATSSPNITQTDRQIFSTTYQTDTWAGKIVAQKIDATTGAVEPTIDWSAEVELLAQVAPASDSRNIYTYTSGGDKVKSFTYSGLDATEKGYFDNKCASFMTQCGTGPNPVPLVGAPLVAANLGLNLVDYLRGQTGMEGISFRDRRFIDPVTEVVTQTVLGDTINAKPAFVRNPLLNFGSIGLPDETYTTFKATQTALNSGAGRSPRLYIGANDGYLHAFNGDTGSEVWAYLPRFLMPGLPALASYGYSTAHSYFVDGSPEATDVFDVTAGVWKTILVGGLNGGGRGFYALDITSAAAPKGLWEFCSSLCSVPGATAAQMVDMGLSYGNPVIGKRSSDGRWVVVVTSGLNNANADGTAGNGDGKGYFFVLDAISGELLEKIGTGVGSTASPSGLMKISALFTSANTDPTFRYIYGGDQLGNVWRVDLGASGVTPPTTPPAATITKLATLKDASSPKRAQPITTRPVLTKIGSDIIVYVGTGRYIGQRDLTDQLTPNSAWQQTLYAFKDKGTDYGADLRNDADMVQQTLTSLSPTTRGTSNNFPSDGWTTRDGWYMDFNPVFGGVAQSPGERVNIDIELILGTLVVVTNVPIPASGVQCEIGGSSWLYQLDFKTGEFVANAPGGVAGSSLGSVITVGIAVVQLPSGAIKGIVTSADTSKNTQGVIIGGSAGSLRRFSYRER